MLPSYRQELVTVLSTHRDPRGLNLQDQYQYLIVEPLNTISGVRSEPLVLSVDALDECGDKDGTEELLRVILEASLHFPLKFFLTGRPESALRQGFQVDNLGHNHKRYQLHDIEHHLVEADIHILVTVVCAHTPLPVSSYSVLLDMELEDVHAALAALHSVVHISNHADPIVSVYHASFPDYLTSSTRSGNQSWYFALEEGHLTLGTKCLELMNLQLDFNIVKLTTSYFSNDKQPSAPFVAPPLAYACTGWGNHLFHSTNVIITKEHTLLGRIDTFLRTKFLYWLEVLSVLNNVQYASTLLLTIDKV
ncbi:hypothetical protein M422DRAFT_154802 [Sphaerobolus stellatus SS14]|nr:hypothetical protein M422DRAFT_154802 [Sphaerobolus stellatus SS14]